MASCAGQVLSLAVGAHRTTQRYFIDLRDRSRLMCNCVQLSVELSIVMSGFVNSGLQSYISEKAGIMI